MERRELICIGCPMGCPMTVDMEGDEITVKGNHCARGAAYAKKEVTSDAGDSSDPGQGAGIHWRCAGTGLRRHRRGSGGHQKCGGKGLTNRGKLPIMTVIS